MSVELATAYYSLLPSMKGTAAAVTAQTATLAAAGGQAGNAVGGAMGAGILATVSKVWKPLAAAFGASKAISYYFDSIQVASDLAESQNAVRVSFGEASDSIATLGETAATRLGLSQSKFNGFATQFSAFASTVAGDGGNVASVIDTITSRGADFASVFNLEVGDALGLFQSGLAGETEPLRRFGIDMSAAAVEAYAMANGIGDGTGALTEQEKVQARYGLLLEQTSKTQGDFANTSDGYANSQRILSARLEDAQASLGQALLPAAEKFTQFMLTDGVPLVEKLIDLFVAAEPAISATADAVIFLTQTGFLGQLGPVLDFFTALGDGKVTLLEMTDIIAGMPEPLKVAFGGLVNFVSGALNTLIGGANGAISAAEAVVNAIGALGGMSISLPRIPGVGTISFDGGSSSGRTGGKSSIPGAADGAWVGATAGGSLLRVGEGRHDEVVLPLSDGVLGDLADGIAAAGGASSPNYIVLNIDGREFMRWFRDENNSRK